MKLRLLIISVLALLTICVSAKAQSATFTDVTLEISDPIKIGLSVRPPSPYVKTYPGPSRSIEFLGGTGGSSPQAMPYGLSAYFTEYGGFYTGVQIVSSNKRFSIDGAIQGVSALPDGSEPSMVSISPDVNGPSLAVEAHGNMVGDFKNQSILAGYDLDSVSGWQTPYSLGYGRKTFALGSRGQMFWGTNLETDPATKAEAKLSITNSNQITVGPQLKVKSDWGLSWPNQTEVVRNTAILRIDAPSGGHSQIYFEEDGATKWVLEQLNYHGASGFPTFTPYSRP